MSLDSNICKYPWNECYLSDGNEIFSLFLFIMNNNNGCLLMCNVQRPCPILYWTPIKFNRKTEIDCQPRLLLLCAKASCLLRTKCAGTIRRIWIGLAFVRGRNGLLQQLVIYRCSKFSPGAVEFLGNGQIDKSFCVYVYRAEGILCWKPLKNKSREENFYLYYKR